MIRWDIEQYSAEQYRQAWELSKKLNMSEILTMQLVRHGITTESNAKLVHSCLTSSILSA